MNSRVLQGKIERSCFTRLLAIFDKNVMNNNISYFFFKMPTSKIFPAHVLGNSKIYIIGTESICRIVCLYIPLTYESNDCELRYRTL